MVSGGGGFGSQSIRQPPIRQPSNTPNSQSTSTVDQFDANSANPANHTNSTNPTNATNASIPGSKDSGYSLFRAEIMDEGCEKDSSLKFRVVCVGCVLYEDMAMIASLRNMTFSLHGSKSERPIIQ